MFYVIAGIASGIAGHYLYPENTLKRILSIAGLSIFATLLMYSLGVR